MKKALYAIFAVTCAIVLGVSLSGCNNTVSSDKLIRRNWSEYDIETFTYDVTYANESKGTLTQTVKPITDGYQIDINQTMDNGDVITGTVKYKNTSAGSAFLPVESIRVAKIGDTTTAQKIVYDGGKIVFYVENGDAITENATVTEHSVTAPYYDNMQFYTIIRGATYDNKFNLSFNVFLPNEKTIAKLACTLGATESLTYTVTAGGEGQSVECQLINISRSQSISGEPSKAYYATTDIIVGEKTVKQALVKFIEGNCTYSLTGIDVTAA